MGRKALEDILRLKLVKEGILEEESNELYLVLWDFKTKTPTPSFYKRIEALKNLTGKLKMLQQSAYLVRGFKLAVLLASTAREFGAEVKVLRISSLVLIPS
ncbi:MAG: hypothetical protein DRJ38_09545 [Thermoprotei archaeon]|nr:MAG: hypothetical protein DRJ38_09545 [Thermoprotei archaeon]